MTRTRRGRLWQRERSSREGPGKSPETECSPPEMTMMPPGKREVERAPGGSLPSDSGAGAPPRAGSGTSRRPSRRPLPADPFLLEIPVDQPATPERRHRARCALLDWREVFGRDGALGVEIGFGRSEFLVEMACRHPEANYVGFEYSRKRVVKFLEKVHRRGVENIRVVCCDAVEVIDQIFRPASVDRFFVLFPDPWPKRRHAKKRFVQSGNIDTMARLLVPGGGLTLRTDDRQYAMQMLDVVDAHPGLRNIAGPGRFCDIPRDPFGTLYQLKYQQRGRPIYFLEYLKRP